LLVIGLAICLPGLSSSHYPAMRELPSTKPDPAVGFARQLEASLADGTFVRLLFSGANDSSDPERILARAVELKGALHLSVTSRYPSRDEVQNLALDQVASWALSQLGTRFRNGLLCTTRADWQFTATKGKKLRLVRHKPSTTSAPGREHDRQRQTRLDESSRDWLIGLGVLSPDGEVRPSMAAKHSQIHRYLEILSHLAQDAGWLSSTRGSLSTGKWTIADMGCGKGYLTFGLWHLCRRVLSLPVSVLGIEQRPELVDAGNRLVNEIGANDLRFICGDIQSVDLPPLRGLIALHACDTATDFALRRGIESGAELIVVAPCCHKEVRPQLGHPAPLTRILKHGIMEERMAEWVTDGLRALVLEWAGYRTKMFEFVSPEHTPKNVMISALRERPPFVDSAARHRIEQLKRFFQIRQHALDPLLSHPIDTP
jgi:hypothetical protein